MGGRKWHRTSVRRHCIKYVSIIVLKYIKKIGMSLDVPIFLFIFAVKVKQ